MYLERLGCGKSQANSHISRDRCPKSPPQICQITKLHWIQLQSDPVDVSKSLKCPPYTSQGWNTATQDTFVHFVGFYATFGLQNRPKTRPVFIYLRHGLELHKWPNNLATILLLLKHSFNQRLRQNNSISAFKLIIILCFDNDYESYCICICICVFVFAYLRICVFVLLSVL